MVQTVPIELASTTLATALAGDPASPAIVLIHGFPSSSAMFRRVLAPLAEHCFVVAPDLPGFGASEPIDEPTFAAYADIVEQLLDEIGVEAMHLYLHDFGAAVGFYLATRTPRRIRSLIVQNANAHESGMGTGWEATRRYWAEPTPERAAAATAHLTYEGTRDQYVAGAPAEIARRIDPQRWEEDWQVMSLPGRLDTQRALVLDYRNHYARFPEIARYLADAQPAALMLWGRHDVFFAIDETLDWIKAVPRMEAHILDGPHFLLETHPDECAELMCRFLLRVDAG